MAIVGMLPNSPTRTHVSEDVLESSRSPPIDSSRELGTREKGIVAIGETHKGVKEKESKTTQWATPEELLDKLLFLAVSGDDLPFITRFLLTYRRFTTPRSVLLAMQRRMRQLDGPTDDPLFTCFAQMRICHLLEVWIRDYPYDFSVQGTTGALSALINSMTSKSYLLHYAAEFHVFLDRDVPDLVDQDAAWAVKVVDTSDTNDDDPYNLEDYDIPGCDVLSLTQSPSTYAKEITAPPIGQIPSWEHTLNLPLRNPASELTSNEVADTSEKQQVKDLVKLAHEVLKSDPDEIAEEITQMEVKLFLNIKPRNWLNFTFVSGKKDEDEPITAFNTLSNRLASWVVSLILCHEQPRARIKQIEKFVEIAHRLRTLNNYSALRAFVAGINNAMFASDETMEQFGLKYPRQAKNLQSWDVLLRHKNSHRAYRLALRNTVGACIPALEVHMSDLIRAHEGNDDSNSSDPTKIHWGKFNMMGRFINDTTKYQHQCNTASNYNFPDRNVFKELFVNRPLMDEEMQRSRVIPPRMDKY